MHMMQMYMRTRIQIWSSKRHRGTLLGGALWIASTCRRMETQQHHHIYLMMLYSDIIYIYIITQHQISL
jgi:hypothetical protein